MLDIFNRLPIRLCLQVALICHHTFVYIIGKDKVYFYIIKKASGLHKSQLYFSETLSAHYPNPNNEAFIFKNSFFSSFLHLIIPWNIRCILNNSLHCECTAQKYSLLFCGLTITIHVAYLCIFFYCSDPSFSPNSLITSGKSIDTTKLLFVIGRFLLKTVTTLFSLKKIILRS